MTEEERRLKCLELAVRAAPYMATKNPLTLAKEFEQYVNETVPVRPDRSPVPSVD